MSADPQSVGFVMRMTGTMTGRMLKGFRSIAVEQGWKVHVLQEWEAIENIPQLIQKWSLSAAFIQGDLYEAHDPAIWGDRPIVTFSPPFPPADAPQPIASVSFDDHAIGAAAAAHLLGLGIQSFAAFMPKRVQFAVDRLAGFREALRGTPVACWDDGLVRSRRFPDPDDFYGFGPWLRSLPRPCGLFAPCDLWGIRTLEWCQSSGVSVPDHVAVVSVDGDDNRCEFADTPLTSIDLPWEQLARSAGSLLVEMLRSNSVRPPLNPVRLSPGQIVKRRSTDLQASGDRDVSEAVALIAARALGPLRPAEVIAHIGSSRNKLRDDFHRIIGRTISEEIQRVRIEEARRLLLTHRDLPIETIARRCGFATPAFFCRTFVRAVGFSPGAFRKNNPPA